MKPLVTYPDVEEMAVDHLAADLEDLDCTVGIGLPATWSTESDPHVQVAFDGTPTDEHPIRQRSTLRIVVWAATTSAAKELANLAHGLLLARHPYRPLTGLLPAHDDEHDAELASFTVRATVRSIPIPDP